MWDCGVEPMALKWTLAPPKTIQTGKITGHMLYSLLGSHLSQFLLELGFSSLKVLNPLLCSGQLLLEIGDFSLKLAFLLVQLIAALVEVERERGGKGNTKAYHYYNVCINRVDTHIHTQQ